MRKGKKIVLTILAVFFATFITACGNLPSHTHTAELVEAKDATCVEKGNIAYYECKICKTAFSDEECKNKLHF